jgi:predicted DNA-binding WGR domain protein
MITKLKRGQFPSGHTEGDFKCFGPAATKDGEFTGTRLCDMGCFKQGEVDSNKYWHGAVIQSKINSQWYFYCEWGRVGTIADRLFEQHDSEASAQRAYEKKCHSKNDKRGEWTNHATLGRILQPKAGDDCYLVRPQAKRSTGLPDAKTISEGVKTVVKAKDKSIKFDDESSKLLSDLNIGTVNYTRSSMATHAVPTLDAIKEARTICDEATKRINKLGLDINDRELEQLTNMLYSRIPKSKNRSKERSDWILTPDNVQIWLQDLDAFEAAAKSQDDVVEVEHDYPFSLEYIGVHTDLFQFVNSFFIKGTRNVHGNVGSLKPKRIWRVERNIKSFIEYQLGVKETNNYFPLHQIPRTDLGIEVEKKYLKSHTFLLFHGTRSVNVSGILRESFRLPKELSNVSISGALFGSGVYFADDYKKSVGYTSHSGSYWASGGGSIKSRGAFMFLCDVVLGKKYIPRYGETHLPQGYNSFFAEMKKSGVHNNEFIVFNKSQATLRYLVEF